MCCWGAFFGWFMYAVSCVALSQMADSAISIRFVNASFIAQHCLLLLAVVSL
jgi:hypothetical protein